MLFTFSQHPDSKVHGANMGSIWGRQDLGGPHVGPMNFAIWGITAPMKFSVNMWIYIMEFKQNIIMFWNYEQ